VALVYDGTNRTLYLNGVVAGEGSAPAIYPDADAASIGNVPAYGSAGFNGGIDEVGIYSRALTFDQIAAIYLAGSHGKCEDMPPAILTQPENQLVLVGSNAVFNVGAVGQQPLYYEWRKNGSALTNAAYASFSTNAGLVVSNISSSDAGTYTVAVSNAFGLVTSSGAALTAAFPAPIVQNFGFETPVVGEGYYQYDPTGAIWTFLNAAGISGNDSGYTWQNPNAPEGVQVAFLQGPGSSISQTMLFSAGTYAVVFSAAETAGYYYPQTFSVALDGNVIGSFAPPETAINYADYATSAFTVTNGNHPLAFLGTDLNNDYSTVFIDDVRVDELFVPPQLGVAGAGVSASGAFLLSVTGQIGQVYTLQASTNLTSWVSVLTFTCTNSPTLVADPTAKNFNWRFYRLVQGTVLAPFTLGFGSAHPWTANGLQLMLQGTIGPTYGIQASSNLLQWQTITNITATNSPVYFTDPDATNYSRRFYRSVVQ
jgi:hypothetical protein